MTFQSIAHWTESYVSNKMCKKCCHFAQILHYLRSKGQDSQIFHLNSHRQEQKRSGDLLLMSWYKFFLPQKRIKYILKINFYPSHNKQWTTILTKPSKSKMCVHRVKLLLSLFTVTKRPSDSNDNQPLHMIPISSVHGTPEQKPKELGHIPHSAFSFFFFI